MLKWLKGTITLLQLLVFTSIFLVAACTQVNDSDNTVPPIRILHGDLLIEFNQNLYTRVNSISGNRVAKLSDFHASEYIQMDNKYVTDFVYKNHQVSEIKDAIGSGTKYQIFGKSSENIEKIVSITVYDKYESLASYRVSYINRSESILRIKKWVNNNYALLVNDKVVRENSAPYFWSYQGASYEDRRDWLTPLKIGFEQQNYMGMNATDYGSGTPITDVWRPDIGIAIGHLETTPKLVSLPVSFENTVAGAKVSIELKKLVILKPDESFQTLNTFIKLHRGDYYSALKQYRQIMAKKGLKAATVTDASYEPIWCAWGYERGFKVDEILGTLEKAQSMGLKWAVIDDGWQTAEGDWYLNPEKFPNGDIDMQNFVKKINGAGLKAKLWWAPLAVDPGTDLIRDHEDMLLLDKDGKPVDITWWDSYYLCPAYDKTLSYSKKLVKTIMQNWGFSGLKLDGQHLNGVPPCYNKKHHHKHPEESVEKLQDFWKLIYETAIGIDKNAVVEICPCGTSYAFHNTPYMNQAVSSDPLSSWQIRTKGKTLKGLMGESAPYYGDHVELSDDASDFASSVGIGAVVGTKFTWPSDQHPELGFVLDQQKEKDWRHWIDIYREKMLPKGTYLGELYDIGFDKPETHVIKKGNNMYYAFYAENWSGSIELKGLTKGDYQVTDYVNQRKFADINADKPTINVDFKKYLLLEVRLLDK